MSIESIGADYTAIALIVDRSGSMHSCAEDTKGGVKQFIAGQKQNPGKASFTLVQFDHQYEVLNNFSDLNQIDEDEFVKQYKPRGSTALLDAMGQTIHEMQKNIDKMEESAKPNRVVVAIVTDGQENSSMNFTIDKIKSLIEEKQSAGWNFIFLSADLNSFNAAESYGLKSSGVVYFDSSNVDKAFQSIDEKVTTARSGGEVAFTDEERSKLAGS